MKDQFIQLRNYNGPAPPECYHYINPLNFRGVSDHGEWRTIQASDGHRYDCEETVDEIFEIFEEGIKKAAAQARLMRPG